MSNVTSIKSCESSDGSLSFYDIRQRNLYGVFKLIQTSNAGQSKVGNYYFRHARQANVMLSMINPNDETAHRFFESDRYLAVSNITPSV